MGSAPEIRTHYRPDDIPRAAERIWGPSPKQRVFLARREYEALFGGSKGPGKSDAILYGGTRQVNHPKYHAALFRRTLTELQDLMDRAAATFPRLGAVWNEQKKRWTFPSGARYSMFYCEQEADKHKHDGKEYHYLGFDQVEQFTETQYLHLIGCSRTSHPGIRCSVRSSANPGGPGHLFVKTRFIDLGDCVSFIDPETGLSRVFVAGRVWDNPWILKNDPAYIQRLLANPDPAQRRAYLEGDWSVFAGQYFSSWDPSVHVLEATLPLSRRRPPDWWEVAGGLDWGYSPHPSVLEVAAFDPHGRARFYKELVAEKTPARDLAAMIVARCETPRELNMTIQGDTQMWTPNQDTGVSIADEMNEVFADRGTGIQLVKANKDRINGWARVHSFLDPRRPQPETGKPGPWLQVLAADPHSGLGCPYLIETLPAQIHDDKRPGDMKKGPNDHGADSTRYLLIAREPLTVIPLAHLARPTHDRRVQAKTREILMRMLKRQAQTGRAMTGELDPDEYDGDEEGAEQLAGIADLWT